MPDARRPREEPGAGDECPDSLRAALRQPVDLGADARGRLAAALGAERRPRPAPRFPSALRWFVRPVHLPLPPLALGAAAAALLLAGVFAGERFARGDARNDARAERVASLAGRDAMRASAPAGGADTVRVIRFVLVAPGAGRVALVGDFNAWDAARTPMRAGGDGGVWTVELPVSAGRHLYAFVVDGTRWVVDPSAPLAPEDGFGTRNSVLVVGAET
jgi:hypothetical protein